MAFPLQQVERELSPFALFASQGLDLYLLPGERFAPYANAVGILRELTYRQQLSGSGQTHDLDSRDPYYDHFLLVESCSGELAGSARLQFVPALPGTEAAAMPPLPEGHQSYLEHVYPGIKTSLAQQGNHLEIGRVALAPRFQRQPHSLMCLFRGGLQVAVSSGYSSIHGLVSYNHFAYPAPVNRLFLSSLMSPPFVDSDAPIPKPRHPVDDIQALSEPGSAITIQGLEQRIRDEISPSFRLPVLLRQYINLMEARVRNLSLARDFNQITEILMAADLNHIPARRLQHFIDFGHHPVYRQFSWYRGA
ncbi:MAG: GNAT family N-acetyltransferase [Cyanobacteria bacterium K_DeepCast_0m_m1_088]|nr:GNAT family N-acetyltransferase [Cyanobacteria bacterium K_DeepCast_0m_m1_088]